MTQSTTDEPEPLRYTGFLIRRAQQAHVAIWQREISNSITNVQFGVLGVLARHPGASQQVLCRELDLDRSTIADLVMRLERNGLIERRRDQLDKRRNRLVLTERGAREVERLRPLVELGETVLTAGLSEQERQTLRELLQKVLSTTSAQEITEDSTDWTPATPMT